MHQELSNAFHSEPPADPLPQYDWQSRSPSRKPPGYFTNHLAANGALATLPRGPLGFDLEWRPNFYKGQAENRVAVVQLASADTVLLLQISRMTGMFSSFSLCHFSRPPNVQNSHPSSRKYSTAQSGSRPASPYSVSNTNG